MKKAQHSSVWIWGYHSVEACFRVKPEDLQEVFYTDDCKLESFLKELSDWGMSLQRVKAFPAQVRERRHQGIAARIKRFPVISWRAFEKSFDPKQEFSQAAVLDRITDPQNYGAILRSAAAFGVQTIFVSNREQAAVDGVVAACSAGNLFRVQQVVCDNLRWVLDFFKDQGLPCLALESSAEEALVSSELPSKALWVLGSEHKGLRPALSEACTKRYKIPMSEGVESLNVSNSAAIAFFALYQSSRLPS